MNAKVVCMVRGGESGRLVQEKAAAFSLQENLTLIFLHIVDQRVSLSENETLNNAWRDEMTWLGRVTLGLARKRAEDRGLKAETVILHGPIYETTIKFLKQNTIARLYIGSPHIGAEDFDKRVNRIKSFAERIQHETNIEVVIAKPEGGNIS
jgi:nucleotide-binding universal stress UspA family protein